MTFHLTDARRMLASVARVTEARNDVHFAEGEGNSFVHNRKTGRRIRLRKEGNVYVMHVRIKIGEKWEKRTIVMDSGAVENVMPRGWFDHIPTQRAQAGVQFGADGTPLGNYGRKLIQFYPEHEDVARVSQRQA